MVSLVASNALISRTILPDGQDLEGASSSHVKYPSSGDAETPNATMHGISIAWPNAVLCDAPIGSQSPSGGTFTKSQ